MFAAPEAGVQLERELANINVPADLPAANSGPNFRVSGPSLETRWTREGEKRWKRPTTRERPERFF
jgi:hypothetical protein